MSHLCPCPACNRHVAVDEATCPFCAAPLPDTFRCQAPPPPRGGRLSRAAMFAAGAALMGVAACESTQPEYGAPIPPPDGGAQADADVSQPEYGAPISPGAASNAGPKQTR